MTTTEENQIRDWLKRIEETDPMMISDVLVKCSKDKSSLTYFLGRAKETWYDR